MLHSPRSFPQPQYARGHDHQELSEKESDIKALKMLTRPSGGFPALSRPATATDGPAGAAGAAAVITCTPTASFSPESAERQYQQTLCRLTLTGLEDVRAILVMTPRNRSPSTNGLCSAQSTTYVLLKKTSPVRASPSQLIDGAADGGPEGQQHSRGTASHVQLTEMQQQHTCPILNLDSLIHQAMTYGRSQQPGGQPLSSPGSTPRSTGSISTGGQRYLMGSIRSCSSTSCLSRMDTMGHSSTGNSMSRTGSMGRSLSYVRLSGFRSSTESGGSGCCSSSGSVSTCPRLAPSPCEGDGGLGIKSRPQGSRRSPWQRAAESFQLEQQQQRQQQLQQQQQDQSTRLAAPIPVGRRPGW